MLIFMAGNSGSKKRESHWFNVLQKRLLSFFEMLDPNDQHYQQGALKIIKKREK